MLGSFSIPCQPPGDEPVDCLLLHLDVGELVGHAVDHTVRHVQSYLRLGGSQVVYFCLHTSYPTILDQ